MPIRACAATMACSAASSARSARRPSRTVVLIPARLEAGGTSLSGVFDQPVDPHRRHQRVSTNETSFEAAQRSPVPASPTTSRTVQCRMVREVPSRPIHPLSPLVSPVTSRPPARTAPTAPHIDRPDPADPDLDPQHGFCETTVHTVRCERAGAGVEKPRPDGSAPGPRIQNGATDPSSSRTRLENAHLHASPEPLTYRAMLWRRELQGRTRRSLHRKLPDRRPNQKT
jgi:hypothetical protein